MTLGFMSNTLINSVSSFVELPLRRIILLASLGLIIGLALVLAHRLPIA